MRPLTGFVPTSQFGARLVGPPKALLLPSHLEADAEDPLSFRHRVGRSAGPPVATARSWVDEMTSAGALRPVHDALIVHAAERDGRTALGLLGDVSIDAYARGDIKAHEKTIAATEQKMVGYMLLTRLFGNPVVLAHRVKPELMARLEGHATTTADVSFTAHDGTHHRMWIVSGDEARTLAELAPNELYIADGHHRLEAARALAEAEGRTNAWFPAGLYAEDQFTVWAFARGVLDAPTKGDALIDRLDSEYTLDAVASDVPRPTGPHTFGTRIDGRSFVLTVPDALVGDDVHARLDTNVLQRLILEPLLGIEDPRTDPRLSVIADPGDHAHEPDLFDAWFMPHPTAMSDVLTVADRGLTMPPKSTYVLPKLPGGVVIRLLDE